MLPYLEVPSIHPDGSFRKVIHPNELEIEWPDTVVLGEGESSEGPVKGAPCACDLALVHEELAVVQPDARHLCVCLCVCACLCLCPCVEGGKGDLLIQMD